MKKLLTLLFIQQMALVPVLAEEIVTPEQEIQNTKGFASINYDRQDNDKEAKQRIINDHSAFNINVIIVKKGALFNKDNADTNDK